MAVLNETLEFVNRDANAAPDVDDADLASIHQLIQRRTADAEHRSRDPNVDEKPRMVIGSGRLTDCSVTRAFHDFHRGRRSRGREDVVTAEVGRSWAVQPRATAAGIRAARCAIRVSWTAAAPFASESSELDAVNRIRTIHLPMSRTEALPTIVLQGLEVLVKMRAPGGLLLVGG